MIQDKSSNFQTYIPKTIITVNLINAQWSKENMLMISCILLRLKKTKKSILLKKKKQFWISHLYSDIECSYNSLSYYVSLYFINSLSLFSLSILSSYFLFYCILSVVYRICYKIDYKIQYFKV